MNNSFISLSDSDTCWRDPDAKSIGYFAKGTVGRVGDALIRQIKDMALETGKNVRMSLHPNADANFHEMIIFQHREKTYLPKKHAYKDKSFHVIAGKMAIFVFDDDGRIVDSCLLDGHQYVMLRVAKNVYHVDIPFTDYVVHHESTLGPFAPNSDDSLIPNWAPVEGELAEYSAYRQKLFDTLQDVGNGSFDVLLTGASGYCGGRILDRLASHGHRIAAVIRPGTIRSDRDGATAENIENVNIIQTDLGSPTGLPRQVKTIVHTAAKSLGPGVTNQDIAADNVEVTRRLIDYARRSGVEKIIFLSSISIYGDVAGSLIDDATPIINPNPYAASKLLCEQMLAECADEISSLSLRLPGVIGPGSKANWLSSVLGQLKAGKPVHFTNPETDFNNAIHLDELAEFVNELVDIPLEGANVINLASEGYISVGEVVELLHQECGSTSELVGVDAPNAPNFTIDIGTASEKMGWTPSNIRDLLIRFADENA
jgi:cupin fold WbuC family metalloprotein